jgi:hypothetical protein
MNRVGWLYGGTNQNGSCDLDTEDAAVARLVAVPQNCLVDIMSMIQSVQLLRVIPVR